MCMRDTMFILKSTLDERLNLLDCFTFPAVQKKTKESMINSF